MDEAVAVGEAGKVVGFDAMPKEVARKHPLAADATADGACGMAGKDTHNAQSLTKARQYRARRSSRPRRGIAMRCTGSGHKVTVCAMPLHGSGWRPTSPQASRWPRHWRAPAWTWATGMGVGGGSRWFICAEGKGQGPPDGGPWVAHASGAEQSSVGVRKLTPTYLADTFFSRIRAIPKVEARTELPRINHGFQVTEASVSYAKSSW